MTDRELRGKLFGNVTTESKQIDFGIAPEVLERATQGGTQVTIKVPYDALITIPGQGVVAACDIPDRALTAGGYFITVDEGSAVSCSTTEHTHNGTTTHTVTRLVKDYAPPTQEKL